MAEKGDWALIKSVVLKAGERALQVPDDTALVPLVQWVKGWLESGARVGDTVTARTRTGRAVKGVLVAVNPGTTHDFGSFVPELLFVQEGILRAMRDEGAAE